MRKLVYQPLFWCWLFVVIWLGHVVAALILERWTGMTISLFGLLAALLVASAIQSRRHKNLYPKDQKSESQRLD